MKSRSTARLSSLLAVSIALFAFVRLPAAEKKSGITIVPEKNSAPQAGEKGRVPPSEKIDPKYTAEGLKDAFQVLCGRLGYRIVRMSVDESEFPFLVYGELAGRCDYRAIRDALGSMPGYAYTGSTTGHKADVATDFVLNMIPYSEYRSRASKETRLRIGDRMKTLRSELGMTR